MDNLPKGWYASKTIWASLLTTIWPLFLVLAKQFNIPMPDADSTAGLLATAGTLVAAGVAIYGRVTAKAPIAAGKPPAGTASAIIAMIAFGCLAGCLSPSQEAAVQSTIAANKVRILSACMTDILPYTQGLPGQAASILVPAAAQAVADVNAACDPANIDAVSASASTLAWFAAQKVVISTNAAVRPATIAPQPITSAS